MAQPFYFPNNFIHIPTPPAVRPDDMVPENLFRKRWDPVANIEYYFSIRNVMFDPHLLSLMSRSLWVRLEDTMPFRQMRKLHIDSLGKMQSLVATAMLAGNSNLECDSTATLIRPKWARWSQITLRIAFPRRGSKKRRREWAKKVLKKALKSVKSSEQACRENDDIQIVTFSQEMNNFFTVDFNVPGVPSLITSFLNNYSDNWMNVSVIKCVDSMLFPPEYMTPAAEFGNGNNMKELHNDIGNQTHVAEDSAVRSCNDHNEFSASETHPEDGEENSGAEPSKDDEASPTSIMSWPDVVKKLLPNISSESPCNVVDLNHLITT